MMWREAVTFADADLNIEIRKHVREKKFSAGEQIVNAEQRVHSLYLLLSGSLRVLRQDATGNEIYLYHLSAAKPLTLFPLFIHSGNKCLVKAVAETACELLQLPVEVSVELMKFPEWRSLIRRNYNRNFEDIMKSVDLLAFSSLRHQLISYLCNRAAAHGAATLVVSHQEIADEMRAHREAISRLLRQLEQEGVLQLGRRRITVVHSAIEFAKTRAGDTP